MNLRKIAGAAAGTVLAAGAAGVISMPSANAFPDRCSDGGVDHASTWVLCTAGTGRYYAHVECVDEVHGYSGYYNGNTVSIGSKSYVTCPLQGGVQWIVYNIFIYVA